MKIGISTACLYPMETEKALKLLTEQKVDLFEVFYNTESELSQEFTAGLKRLLSMGNARLKSVHPFTSGYEPYMLFSTYERRFYDSIEFYKQYFHAAAELGAEFLVLHGDRKTPETGGISDEDYFEKFAHLAKAGKEFGITVAQENVTRFRSQKPEFIEKMKNYLGDTAHFVLDIKQAVRSGYDPMVICAAMGEQLVHVHVNDHNSTEDCLVPGAGETDYIALFNLLKQNHYKGDMVIEVYRHNFRNTCDLIAAKTHLEQLWAIEKRKDKKQKLALSAQKSSSK